jgi:hypothetical protein
MQKNIFYVSDCCGVESDMDHKICSKCGEHCEIVTDDSMVEENEPDYLPGYDDGEWDPVMGDGDDWIETDDQWLDDFCGEEDWA